MRLKFLLDVDFYYIWSVILIIYVVLRVVLKFVVWQLWESFMGVEVVCGW